MKKIEKLQNEIDMIDDKVKNMDEETQNKEYLKLKLRMRKIVRKGWIAEVQIFFSDKENAYKIYGFPHYVIFARDGEDIYFEKSDYLYKTLDELYLAENMDSVCLKRDWKKISECRIRALRLVNKSEEN